MKPIEIINKVEKEVEKAIAKINLMYQQSPEEYQEELMSTLEDHIAFGIFLRELKEKLENGESVEKEYFGKQMLNICKSCATVNEMYKAGRIED